MNEIIENASVYFAYEGEISRSSLEDLIREAIRETDEDFGAQAAVAWAAGYQFPQEMLDSDLRCFQAAQLDFVAMVRRRLKVLASDWLNSTRVDQLRDDNPEKTLLYDLAEGMRVPLPPGFIPNGRSTTARLRGTYLRVHTAVNKMLGDVVKQRLAFVLPKALAVSLIDNLHLGAAHWTVKKGKPSGRPIGDLTYVDGTPLNSDHTTSEAANYYGGIRHPTIEDIVTMILKFWARAKERDPEARWEDLRLRKMDLKGAYTLLSFRPEDAGLFGMELTGDLVYLQIAGIFGWACTPAAFQVVTRALKWELSHVLQSMTEMYVNDIIAVCMDKDLASDLVTAKGVCTRLLGLMAVANDKTEWGIRLDVLGYIIDLASRKLSIARKNFMNAIYGFMKVDLSLPMSLHTAQRLASWGSRYSMICRVMRPFCGALHRLSHGRKERQATFHLSEEAKIAIRGWRAMLCLVHLDEQRFTRSLDSFRDEVPSYVIEFDASLNGAGIIWFSKADNGTEVCMGASAVDLSGLGFGEDSSYQNTSEYIGAILGMIGLVKMNVRSVDIELRGDSIAALTWAKTERCRGSLVTNASMVFTMLCVAFNLDVKSATHIAGKDNLVCDRLSRLGASGQSVASVVSECGFGEVQVIDLGLCDNTQYLLSSCNPAISFAAEPEFVSYWSDVRRAINNI